MTGLVFSLAFTFPLLSTLFLRLSLIIWAKNNRRMHLHFNLFFFNFFFILETTGFVFRCMCECSLWEFDLFHWSLCWLSTPAHLTPDDEVQVQTVIFNTRVHFYSQEEKVFTLFHSIRDRSIWKFCYTLQTAQLVGFWCVKPQIWIYLTSVCWWETGTWLFSTVMLLSYYIIIVVVTIIVRIMK